MDNMDDEIETNHQRRTPADEAVPASCDGENDPPQPLALLPGGDSGPPDPIPVQQQEQLALGDEEVEVHESALSIVEDDSYCAPIPIQQREQQIDDAKRKAKAEISTAIGARGRDERDSTTELVAAKERDEDLRPIAARSRVGESLGEVEEEETPSMPSPRQRSGPSLCLADCDDNDPPVPIQQQVQLLALDDQAVKNKKKQEAKAGEQKSVMTFVDEEGSNRAPIPIQQQMHQFDDAKEKATSGLSMANSASGRDERESITEPTAEEMEEGEVNLRPSVGSRAGASWGELEEARVEILSIPTARNDAADAHLAPDEEIPIIDGIVVPTERTRLQTWVENFRDNYKSILGLTILVIASSTTVGIVLDGRRSVSREPPGNPDIDMVEHSVDPADLFFDPDDTTGIPGHALHGNSECDDGTICENNSQCIPHPIKEGKYICDCLAVNNVAKAKGGLDVALEQFAGIYCEHKATSYCTKAHAFCTNGGECKLSVGKKEKHAGCKCPSGYEGEFCQFIEGSMPSDWTLDNFMHPAIISEYGNNGGMNMGGMNMSQTTGAIAGTVTGFVALVMCLGSFHHLRQAGPQAGGVEGEEIR